ncbi:M23 family metallopeptidase [Stackebrandtia nassauensis]|uniref:Peptidase M23 n=1 Tax=Stackebrandtia nassauensis (strain DSM 44728 / CIP 108903 / NRRL B-16338 / NBRC 102104 / LLR-40K-21) TaxID=446470 RepID=D3PVT9_STANL|nr:M23 family metallopeptidase [Stackebrandtia nassauensis]ADD45060.1 Peptidase M23 [Stackebrandtia nassauensis DSM 44728]
MSESHPLTLKIGLAIAAVMVLPLVAVVALAIVAVSTDDAAESGGVTCSITKKTATALGLSKTQLGHAATIYEVALDKSMGRRAAIIGIATAIQESTLHNYGHLGDRNDHDSLGLFQQRPSAGWGSPTQITNPKYAAGKFFDSLKKVSGWQSLPLTVAAQTVQGSAFPDAYAKHEPKAKKIVNTLENPRICAAGTGSGKWAKPVNAGIVSGYRTSERPDHHGIDFGAARGTTIKAVGAGTVKTVTCNASTGAGQPYSCNIDGGVHIMGCGWYVEIQHADKTVTRYCHMVSRPSVNEGQKVNAGQKLGKVGNSGNSSGPHLHFEAHGDYPADPGNAIDPRKYLKDRGISVS